MTRWHPPTRCGACPDGARVQRWQPQPGDGWQAQPCGHTLADIHTALTEALATRLLPNPWDTRREVSDAPPQPA